MWLNRSTHLQQSPAPSHPYPPCTVRSPPIPCQHYYYYYQWWAPPIPCQHYYYYYQWWSPQLFSRLFNKVLVVLYTLKHKNIYLKRHEMFNTLLILLLNTGVTNPSRPAPKQSFFWPLWSGIVLIFYCCLMITKWSSNSRPVPCQPDHSLYMTLPIHLFSFWKKLNNLNDISVQCLITFQIFSVSEFSRRWIIQF